MGVRALRFLPMRCCRCAGRKSARSNRKNGGPLSLCRSCIILSHFEMVTMTQDLGQAVNASQLSSTPALPIASIVVGDRHRHDMGDLAELAANIADVGLLHPIVVRPDGMLIAGERRLKACAALGWADIPVTVVDLDDIKRGELSENVHRKAFLPSEIEAIRRALMPVEAAVAKERMAEGGKGGKLSQPSTEPERARDKVAAFARVSGR